MCSFKSFPLKDFKMSSQARTPMTVEEYNSLIVTIRALLEKYFFVPTVSGRKLTMEQYLNLFLDKTSHLDPFNPGDVDGFSRALVSETLDNLKKILIFCKSNAEKTQMPKNEYKQLIAAVGKLLLFWRNQFGTNGSCVSTCGVNDVNDEYTSVLSALSGIDWSAMHGVDEELYALYREKDDVLREKFPYTGPTFDELFDARD